MPKLRIEVRGLCCLVRERAADGSETLTLLLLKDTMYGKHKPMDHGKHSPEGGTKANDYGPHVARMYVKHHHIPGADESEEYQPFELEGADVRWPSSVKQGSPSFPQRLTDLTTQFGCQFKGFSSVEDLVVASIPLPFNTLNEENNGTKCNYKSDGNCSTIDAGRLDALLVFEADLADDEFELDLPEGKKKFKAKNDKLQLEINNLPQKLSRGGPINPKDDRGDPRHFLMLYDLFENCKDNCRYYPIAVKDGDGTEQMTSSLFTCMPGGGS